MTCLAAALRYAAAGWPTFPCRPDEKRPLTRHGCLDATCDPDQIRAWWARWPTANVAVATGDPGPDVVDVDVKHGSAGPESYHRLRAAGLLRGAHAFITTPSGGWHLYYAGTAQGNGALARHGVDFRSSGGYVLAPPSVVGGHRYVLTQHRPQTGVTVSWDAIRRKLDPPPPPRPPRPPARKGRVDDHGELIRWMADQFEGNRNGALYWAAGRALATGADPRVLDDLTAAAVTAGLPRAEAERTIRSALQRAGRR
ncbi:bifunctional DNA primase/polymerase [Micromonospora aurantiaca (nom. illeg.)]|uniref:bifunctional DNA primase/polymerase n=1 Tax=Micromonospora aurantiaca (nom. illeg.) TaxID=47850 RepID=UPI003F4A6531